MLKIHINLIFLCYLLIGCVSTKKVFFEDIVDTNDKAINIQDKKVFSFDKSEVYFSNRFEGARLNDVKKENDSTFILFINPENEPINLSPYYAFKVWSKSPRNISLKFNYPKGYSHRYMPKILSEGKWKITDSISFNNNILKLKVSKNSKIVSGQELNSSNIVYNWVNSILRDKQNYASFKEIGKTKLKRSFMVIDINKGNKEKKPIVVLITRQHPPEVTGYFAFQSFLSTILE
ncbi:MAG: M14 family zinc carboxypeptidase, partial [Flavobacteriaceae bacterium]